MDDRYEFDRKIDDIVRSMGDRTFTAKDVRTLLARGNPKNVPDAKAVGVYLKSSPLTETITKPHGANQYRFKPPLPENAMAPEELERMMSKVRECEHTWVYQPAAEVCPKCTAYREITEEDPEAIKVMKEEYNDKIFRKLRNDGLARKYVEFMEDSALRDTTKESGKKAAIHSTFIAQACAEVMIMNAKRQRQNIKRTIQ